MKCKECVYCDIKSSKLDEELYCTVYQETITVDEFECPEYSSLKDFEEFSKYC